MALDRQVGKVVRFDICPSQPAPLAARHHPPMDVPPVLFPCVPLRSLALETYTPLFSYIPREESKGKASLWLS